MSYAGETDDNAIAESLFSSYQTELLVSEAFATVAEARAETAHYLDDYYNQVRRHSALGYVSPAEYEFNYPAQAANPVE